MTGTGEVFQWKIGGNIEDVRMPNVARFYASFQYSCLRHIHSDPNNHEIFFLLYVGFEEETDPRRQIATQPFLKDAPQSLDRVQPQAVYGAFKSYHVADHVTLMAHQAESKSDTLSEWVDAPTFRKHKRHPGLPTLAALTFDLYTNMIRTQIFHMPSTTEEGGFKNQRFFPYQGFIWEDQLLIPGYAREKDAGPSVLRVNACDGCCERAILAANKLSACRWGRCLGDSEDGRIFTDYIQGDDEYVVLYKKAGYTVMHYDTVEPPP